MERTDATERGDRVESGRTGRGERVESLGKVNTPEQVNPPDRVSPTTAEARTAEQLSVPGKVNPGIPTDKGGLTEGWRGVQERMGAMQGAQGREKREGAQGREKQHVSMREGAQGREKQHVSASLHEPELAGKMMEVEAGSEGERRAREQSVGTAVSSSAVSPSSSSSSFSSSSSSPSNASFSSSLASASCPPGMIATTPRPVSDAAWELITAAQRAPLPLAPDPPSSR
eukprot:3702478-Rhodomonas_salina.1